MRDIEALKIEYEKLYEKKRVRQPVPMHIILLQEVFRDVIADQIIKLKDEWFKEKKYIKCAITGFPITRAVCDADHYPTSFATLTYNFIKWHYPNGLKQKDMTETTLHVLIHDFADYHLKHAQLRPTFKIANRRCDKDDYDWSQLVYVTQSEHVMDKLNNMCY